MLSSDMMVSYLFISIRVAIHAFRELRQNRKAITLKLDQDCWYMKPLYLLIRRLSRDLQTTLQAASECVECRQIWKKKNVYKNP